MYVGTHISAPRPTRQSADCWPSYGERIAAQYSTCKSTHVRTDTRPSWPHRARTVTDMWSLNFDGHVSVTSNSKETCSSTNSEIVALGLHTDMCGLTVTEPSPHRQSADSRVGHGAVMCVPTFSRPYAGRHTVKELQRSFQPASPHMSAPTPDRRGRTVPAPSPICGV
ncbi:hypothetical protein J6590_005785 [Homalodisca vitripennis]|nr:hypothetical protein J6590_005785 [Homalodisca vitripennis]